MIQVSVSVSFDTLTGAICHAMIYGIKLYIKMFMYQMLHLCVPVEKPVENSQYPVICGIVSYVLAHTDV